MWLLCTFPKLNGIEHIFLFLISLTRAVWSRIVVVLQNLDWADSAPGIIKEPSIFQSFSFPHKRDDDYHQWLDTCSIIITMDKIDQVCFSCCTLLLLSIFHSHSHTINKRRLSPQLGGCKCLCNPTNKCSTQQLAPLGARNSSKSLPTNLCTVEKQIIACVCKKGKHQRYLVYSSNGHITSSKSSFVNSLLEQEKKSSFRMVGNVKHLLHRRSYEQATSGTNWRVKSGNSKESQSLPRLRPVNCKLPC